jgi:hypothetical protein
MEGSGSVFGILVSFACRANKYLRNAASPHFKSFITNFVGFTFSLTKRSKLMTEESENPEQYKMIRSDFHDLPYAEQEVHDKYTGKISGPLSSVVRPDPRIRNSV